jgi:hypothetical protein
MRRNYGSVAFALAGGLLFLASTTAATAADNKPFPALKDLSTFYVGGTIKFSDCNDSANCDNPRQGPGNISVDAMYVEKATPASQKYSIPLSSCTVEATAVSST